MPPPELVEWLCGLFVCAKLPSSTWTNNWYGPGVRIGGRNIAISPTATYSRKPFQWPWPQTAQPKTQLREQACTL
jgi:hypothetical protein